MVGCEDVEVTVGVGRAAIVGGFVVVAGAPNLKDEDAFEISLCAGLDAPNTNEPVLLLTDEELVTGLDDIPNLKVGAGAEPAAADDSLSVRGLGFFSEQQTHVAAVGLLSTMHVGHFHFFVTEAVTAGVGAGAETGLGFFSEQQTQVGASGSFSIIQVGHLHFLLVAFAFVVAGFEVSVLGCFSLQQTQKGTETSFSTMQVEQRHFGSILFWVKGRNFGFESAPPVSGDFATEEL